MNESLDRLRRVLTDVINNDVQSTDPTEERERLAVGHGKVWDTEELRREFEVKGFAAPFVVVRRKSDGVIGTLMFQNSPRLYFNFTAD